VATDRSSFRLRRSTSTRGSRGVGGLNELIVTASGPEADFATWPEYVALDRAGAADAVTTRRTMATCRAFRTDPWLGPDEAYAEICGTADTYLADLSKAVATTNRATAPESSALTLQSLVSSAQTLDSDLANRLAFELTKVVPPPVFTVWHALLLARFSVPVVMEIDGVTIPEIAVSNEGFSWYTNLAGYTCEGFTIDPVDY
jgi:hypothetical protein